MDISKIRGNDDTIFAVALGVGTVLDIAIEDGIITEEQALLLTEKVAHKMNRDHDKYHEQTGTPCRHKGEGETVH